MRTIINAIVFLVFVGIVVVGAIILSQSGFKTGLEDSVPITPTSTPSNTPQPSATPSPTPTLEPVLATATLERVTQVAATQVAATATMEWSENRPSVDQFNQAMETWQRCAYRTALDFPGEIACANAYGVIMHRHQFAPLTDLEWARLTPQAPTAAPTQLPPSATMRPTSTLQASGFIVVTATPIQGWIVVATGEPTPQG